MSIFHRSYSGSPSTIQCATWRPIPPAPAIPWAEKPAATQKPRTSVSPRMNSLSGVKPSGPLMSCCTPASAIAGTRWTAPRLISSKRGQSGGRSLPLKSGGDAVQSPGGRVALVAAHHQAAHLGPEVDQVIRVAQLGQVRRHALDRLGDQVLVRERDDRDGDPGQAADLRGEHARRVDDDLGLDRSGIGLHPGHAPVLDGDGGDPGPGPDVDPSLARAGGQGLGQARGVEVAVGRQPGRAEHALGRHQREAALRLVAPTRAPSSRP